MNFMGILSWLDKASAPKDTEQIVDILSGVRDVHSDLIKFFISTANTSMHSNPEKEQELLTACFMLTWPTDKSSEENMINNTLKAYTKNICIYPFERDRKGRLKFTETFKRLDKYILPFNKAIREIAYEILNSNKILEWHRTVSNDGLNVYKLPSKCSSCEYSCYMNVIAETKEREIPTCCHATIRLVEQVDDIKSKSDYNKCCICASKINRCEYCKKR